MIERTSEALSCTPADYLSALQTFLAKTSQVVQEQHYWLEVGRAFMTPALVEQHDQMITEQIATNVEHVSSFVQQLGSIGMLVVVQSGDTFRQPLQGIAFQVEDCQYAAGVMLPDGPTLLPLDETVQLGIYPMY